MLNHEDQKLVQAVLRDAIAGLAALQKGRMMALKKKPTPRAKSAKSVKSSLVPPPRALSTLRRGFQVLGLKLRMRRDEAEVIEILRDDAVIHVVDNLHSLDGYLAGYQQGLSGRAPQTSAPAPTEPTPEPEVTPDAPPPEDGIAGA